MRVRSAYLLTHVQLRMHRGRKYGIQCMSTKFNTDFFKDMCVITWLIQKSD